METGMVIENCEEREEGEIIDDDNDFEDISDNSLILPIQTGKCDSPKEHLRGISLSSIDDGDSTIKMRCRKKSLSKKRQKIEKRRNSRKKSVISVSDSEDEVSLSNIYRRQIKAAIQIEKPDNQHNSLKARLKLVTPSENECETNASVNGNSLIKDDLKTSEDTHTDLDNELMQLRAEALKTAVFNKYKSKKRKKIKTVSREDTLSDIDVKSDISDTNKENNGSENLTIENSVDINNEQKTDLNTTADDDEDVLRAMLLASMSKKMTQEQDIQKIQSETKKTALVQPALPTKFVQKRKITQKILPQMPEVKPLIITLNGDSDTDDESDNKETNSTVNSVKTMSTVDINTSVENFLKEQRAQVEAKVAANAKTPILKNKPSNNILMKSSVKLLPKDKQIEYQKLVQQLSLANKKTPIKKKVEVKQIVRKPFKAKLPVSQNGETTRQEILTFRQIYKEMQGQLNGRLQIQEKYKHLKPDILKIVEVNNQRRKYEQKVAELLEELKTTKLKVQQSQQLFRSRVNGLVLNKQIIDRSIKQKMLKKTSPVQSNQNTAKQNTVNLPEQAIPLATKVAEVALDTTINYGDPNDIHKILNLPTLTIEQSSLSNYISPLDMKRDNNIDPHGILCPFSINGNCRDKDCSFKHIL